MFVIHRHQLFHATVKIACISEHPIGRFHSRLKFSFMLKRLYKLPKRKYVELTRNIKKTKMNVDILRKTYYQCHFCMKYITVESSKRNENILIVSFKIEIKLMGKRYVSKLMIIYIQS